MNAEHYSNRTVDVDGWPVVVESYCVGDRYYCSVSSSDPGARFARSEGASREEAERIALEKARRYLAQTRVHRMEG